MHRHTFAVGVVAITIIAAIVVFSGFHFEHSSGLMLAEGAAAASAADVQALARKLGEITAQFNSKSRELEDKTAQVSELSARLTGVEQEMVRKGGPSGGGASNSIGAMLMRHPEFNAVAGLAERRGKITLNVKAMITTAPDSGGALVPPDVRADPILIQRRRLIVRNLVAGGQTTSGLVQYPKQTVRDLNANVVSEGGRKPESNIDFELADAPARVIAHWTKASRQILSDAPQLRTTVDGELRYGVALAEETELLFGDGSGQHLLGIVPQATDYEADRNRVGDNRFDTIAHAFAQAQVAQLPATGLVMNDDDLEALKVIKDDQGRYIGDGPFGPPITTVWGRPVVGTPIMASGHFLGGAFFDGAQIYDREDVNVMIATENEDDFIHNLATLLCEERVAFAVKRPQAFIYGQFPNVTG